MKAVCRYGTNDFRVEEVDEPRIRNGRDGRSRYKHGDLRLGPPPLRLDSESEGYALFKQETDA